MAEQNQLNDVKALFKQALTEIFSTDEIDKIIKYAPYRKRKYLKNLKKMFQFSKGTLFYDNSYILILTWIKCKDLYDDVFTYMVNIENRQKNELYREKLNKHLGDIK